MPTPTEFLEATKWSGLITLLLLGITAIAFLLKWGIRFRLVGVTGFMTVLTVGFFGLSIVPITRTVVPGAIRYSTVYDSGAAQVVIKVPSTISETELEATLKQAAFNLFTSGRQGTPGQPPTIRARTILHPEPGVSNLIYLGQVQRSQSANPAEKFKVTLYPDGLSALDTVVGDESATATPS
jgi:hypothetical protein